MKLDALRYYTVEDLLAMRQEDFLILLFMKIQNIEARLAIGRDAVALAMEKSV